MVLEPAAHDCYNTQCSPGFFNPNQKVHGLFQFYKAVTVPTTPVLTKHSKKRRFLYFNHLSKEFLEQMIPHFKALIESV